MNIYFLTKSKTLKRHLDKMDLSELGVEIVKEINFKNIRPCVVLVHTNSIKNCREIVRKLNDKKDVYVGVSSDVPNVHQFLELSEFKISCYFNSYMANVHYFQMIEMVLAGQKWIVPEVLSGTLDLAMKAEKNQKEEYTESDIFKTLTKKEQQVAFYVRDCLSNKEIAKKQSVTERTVKAHLTNIFKKLSIKDRTTLATKLS